MEGEGREEEEGGRKRREEEEGGRGGREEEEGGRGGREEEEGGRKRREEEEGGRKRREEEEGGRGGRKRREEKEEGRVIPAKPHPLPKAHYSLTFSCSLANWYTVSLYSKSFLSRSVKLQQQETITAFNSETK